MNGSTSGVRCCEPGWCIRERYRNLGGERDQYQYNRNFGDHYAGAGIDSLKVSTLAGNDSINLSGVLAPITTTVLGGDDNDTIVGSPQSDLLYGGFGNDIIIGGAGVDVAYGEEGDDRFGDPAVADPAANDAGNDQLLRWCRLGYFDLGSG